MYWSLIKNFGFLRKIFGEKKSKFLCFLIPAVLLSNLIDFLALISLKNMPSLMIFITLPLKISVLIFGFSFPLKGILPNIGVVGSLLI